MAKTELHETVLREFCKSSPSATQALQELLEQNARLTSETRLVEELRILAEAIVDNDSSQEALIRMAKSILGYAC